MRVSEEFRVWRVLPRFMQKRGRIKVGTLNEK